MNFCLAIQPRKNKTGKKSSRCLTFFLFPSYFRCHAKSWPFYFISSSWVLLLGCWWKDFIFTAWWSKCLGQKRASIYITMELDGVRVQQHFPMNLLKTCSDTACMNPGHIICIVCICYINYFELHSIVFDPRILESHRQQFTTSNTGSKLWVACMVNILFKTLCTTQKKKSYCHCSRDMWMTLDKAPQLKKKKRNWYTETKGWLWKRIKEETIWIITDNFKNI